MSILSYKCLYSNSLSSISVVTITKFCKYINFVSFCSIQNVLYYTYIHKGVSKEIPKISQYSHQSKLYLLKCVFGEIFNALTRLIIYMNVYAWEIETNQRCIYCNIGQKNITSVRDLFAARISIYLLSSKWFRVTYVCHLMCFYHILCHRNGHQSEKCLLPRSWLYLLCQSNRHDLNINLSA